MMHDRAVTISSDGVLPHWPRRLVDLPGGGRVSVAATFFSPEDAAEGAPLEPAGEPLPAGRELVLCVHGMAGSATNWTDFMAELAGEYDCAAVDLPGAGWSPPPASRAGYQVSSQAQVVTEVIERLGRGPVHLVGNSMGGLIAVKAAASRPDLVRTLALVSPALPDPLIRPALARFPLIGLPWLGQWLMRRADAFPAEARTRAVMATIFRDPGSVHPQRFRQAVAELERRDRLSHASESLIGAARAITREYLRPGRSASNGWQAAARVRCPVLAIYGTHDQLVNPKRAARAARAFRDSRVIVLPDTGHVAQMEDPARVASLFRELAAAGSLAAAGRLDAEAGPARSSVATRGMPPHPGGLEPVTETLN